MSLQIVVKLIQRKRGRDLRSNNEPSNAEYNNNNNNNNIFIFFRQGTHQLHRYLLTTFAVPLLLRKVNNVAIFVPISSRKRDTREAV